MRQRNLLDIIFDRTMDAIGVGLYLALFVLVWLISALALGLFLALFLGVSSLWLIAALALVPACFVTWFVYRLADHTATGIVETFGNDPTESASGPAKRLEQLRDLRDRKLISQEEYESQREQILRNI